ncbi:MAG TPA: beta-propeller domain-containing protein, partial [Polyangia bacterium]
MRAPQLRAFYLLLSSVIIAACADSGPNQPPPPTDLPTYVSQAPASNGANGLTVDQAGGASLPPAGPAAATSDTTKTAAPVVPGGRVADVQEADVYKIQDGKLYLLNTYRGFLVYDISNTQKPVRLSHLPVYGYPVEMFVENNTVYALLSDSLYLTQINGQLQFQRRNTSQIVTIDISDPANPKLLQAQDLAGQLREGVSRKIENSIYVVSYQPSGYWYYGWGPQNGQQPNEQAWVYSFDASTPSNLKQVGQIKVFEGGSTSTYNQATGESHGRNSNGVTLSATSNAIMVVQNWYTYDYVPGVPVYQSGDPDGGVSS